MFFFIRASMVMLSLHINRNPKTSCQGPLISTDNTIDTKTRGIDCKSHILMITFEKSEARRHSVSFWIENWPVLFNVINKGLAHDIKPK